MSRRLRRKYGRSKLNAYERGKVAEARKVLRMSDSEYARHVAALKARGYKGGMLRSDAQFTLDVLGVKR